MLWSSPRQVQTRQVHTGCVWSVGRRTGRTGSHRLTHWREQGRRPVLFEHCSCQLRYQAVAIHVRIPAPACPFSTLRKPGRATTWTTVWGVSTQVLTRDQAASPAAAQERTSPTPATIRMPLSAASERTAVEVSNLSPVCKNGTFRQQVGLLQQGCHHDPLDNV